MHVSPSRLQHTFTLRDGVKFHSGRPVTAEDVKYSFERIANPATGSPWQPYSSATSLAQMPDFREEPPRLAGYACSTIGPSNSPSMRRTVASHEADLSVTFVVDRAQIESSPLDWARRPNGTGPFKLAEWTANARLTLEANSDYYSEPPFLERVMFNLESIMGTSYTRTATWTSRGSARIQLLSHQWTKSRPKPTCRPTLLG